MTDPELEGQLSLDDVDGERIATPRPVPARADGCICHDPAPGGLGILVVRRCPVHDPHDEAYGS